MESTSSNERTSFQKERDNLINSIAQGLEQVITNIGLLNKNLESIITVGKEFENAAALWKTFTNVPNDVSFPHVFNFIV